MKAATILSSVWLICSVLGISSPALGEWVIEETHQLPDIWQDYEQRTELMDVAINNNGVACVATQFGVQALVTFVNRFGRTIKRFSPRDHVSDPQERVVLMMDVAVEPNGGFVLLGNAQMNEWPEPWINVQHNRGLLIRTDESGNVLSSIIMDQSTNVLFRKVVATPGGFVCIGNRYPEDPEGVFQSDV